MIYFQKFEVAGGNHRYDVGVKRDDGRIGLVDVIAKNRTQAAAVARANGYVVRDVNMVG